MTLLLSLGGLSLPQATLAEGLVLDPAVAAECPDCATPTGGAQVINYFQQLAPQSDVTLTPPDGAPAPDGGWHASAESMVADEGATQAATGSAAEAADTVASTSVLAEEAAGAIPELCATGILCPATLAVGAFGTGYLIGTGAKALYLKFFGGDDPNTDPILSGLTWKRWDGPGDTRLEDYNSGPIVHPREYYLGWWESNVWGSNFDTGAWHGTIVGTQCVFGPPQPHAVIVRSGTTHLRCDDDPPQPLVSYIKTPEMLMTHNRPPAPAGSVDTTGATSVPSPSTPSRSDFAGAATSVLNSSSVLRRWMEHELSPRCNADPTKTQVNVPSPLLNETAAQFEACLTHLGLAPTEVELPETVLDAQADDPVLSSPGDDATVDAGTTVVVYVNPPAARPKTRRDERCRPDDAGPVGDPGPAPPGYTGSDPRFQSRPAPALAGYPGLDLLTASPRTVRLWWGWVPTPGKGWGYRHIMDRRGYGPGDEADTAAALLDPTPVPVDPVAGTSYLFHKFYNVTDVGTAETVHCARTVLVNFFQRDVEPAPRDIITSYYGSYES